MNIFTVLITQPLANGLILCYQLFGQNMGLAIIGFSLILRVGLTPLTKPYMESMKKLKTYQKDLAKLKERHKGDRTKLMKAQADFYKEKGINPTAGCLPQILQIVILIALFNVFRTVLSGNADQLTTFNNLLYTPLHFPSGVSLNTQFLYLDVTKPDVFHIPGVPFALPGVIVILAAFFQFLSAKIASPYVETEKKIAKKTAGEADDMAVAIQSSMIYTFPLMTLFIGVSFPSGLALYWLLFSLFQAFQQYRSTGWGGATPFLQRLGLVQSGLKNGTAKTN